jgi:hypothetical protein
MVRKHHCSEGVGSEANRTDEATASDSKNNKILGVKKCKAF